MTPGRLLLSCCLGFLLGGAATASAPAATDSPEPAAVLLATFRCDVTPPLGHPLCGGWIKPLAGIDDPELAKGVILRETGGKTESTYVLCVVDWCELRNDAYDRFRQRLAEAAGTVPSRVALTCLHAHNAPITDRRAQELLAGEKNPPVHADLAFLDAAIDKTAAALRTALTRLRPITHIGTGAARVERVASNRRVPGPNGAIRVRYSSTKDTSLHAAPEGLIDPWLKTVSFFAADKPVAYLHYYATHPQSYYGDGRATCDFPGIARERLEKETGIFQLHFTGCAGDVTAGKYNDGTPPRRTELANRIYEAMRRSMATIRRRPVSPVTWTVRPVILPNRTEPDHSEAYHTKRLKDPTAKPKDRLGSALALAWLERNKARRPVELSCLAMGPVRLLHLPGEPFVTFQLEAQRLRPDLFVATSAYTDCGMGYICTEASCAEGGYEPTATYLAPVSEYYFRNAIRDLLTGRKPPPVLKSVSRIWNAAPHNAFTDLIRFRDRWFCAFREGARHVSEEAAIRVITSADGADWQPAGRIAQAGADLRDPKFSITPAGRLMIVCGRRTWPPNHARTVQSCVTFSTDGATWTTPVTVLDEGLWLWRVTWHEGTAYGVAYESGKTDRAARQAHLYAGKDGIHYTRITTFSARPGLGEATIRFDPAGTAYCLQRRDAETRTALVGTGSPPYREWRWRDTGFYLGGPNVVYHGGTWWAAGRWQAGAPKTVLARLDGERGTLEPARFLPSGGDTGYPGLVSWKGVLWMSYYSSHNGKAAIYLARFGKK